MLESPDESLLSTTAQLKALLSSEAGSSSAVYISRLSFLDDPAVVSVPNFEEAVRRQLAFVLQEDSELREVLNLALLRIRQSGVLRSILHRHTEGDRPPTREDRIFTKEAAAVAPANLAIPAGALVSGLIAAAAAGVAEKAFTGARSQQT